MGKTTKSESRKAIRGNGWKRSMTIAKDKYEAITNAILDSLTETPITFSQLVDFVKAKLPTFDGSIPWYTLTCLRELETQRRVEKHRRPVLYSKLHGKRKGNSKGRIPC